MAEPASSSRAAVPVLMFSVSSNQESFRQQLVAAGVPATYAEDIPDLSVVEFAVLWRPPPGLLQQCTHLRVAASTGAGVDHLLEGGQVPPHVPIVRIVDPLMAQRMATYVMWGVINWQRQMDAYAAAQRDSRWDKEIENFDSIDNAAVTVGVMGYGGMGEATAAMLLMCGYTVLAWARTPRPQESPAAADGAGGGSTAGRLPAAASVELLCGQARLKEFVGRCNVLVCLLPLTPATEGILNAELLSWLPRGSALINVARGAHLVEADLLAALNSGQVGHALLDVFHQEPLPPSCPLWAHPHVRITPHVSSNTALPNAVAQVKENYTRMLQGQPLLNVACRTAGY